MFFSIILLATQCITQDDLNRISNNYKRMNYYTCISGFNFGVQFTKKFKERKNDKKNYKLAKVNICNNYYATLFGEKF